jgi:hypothetical protein
MTTPANVCCACAFRGVLESNSDLEAQTTTPSSPAPGSASENVAVQLLDHGTGSGVKKPSDRWARSRAKAARATTDPE